MIVRGIDSWHLRDPYTGRLVDGGEKAAQDLIERKFDPNQTRDPGGEHGGQWVRSIFREVVHTGHGDIMTHADRTGSHLQFGGSSSGRLDDRAMSELADLLGEVGYDDHGRYPRTPSVATYANGEVVGFAALHRPDYRTAELELLNSDARLPLTAGDAANLGPTVLRARSAWRVDADSGQVDGWVNDRDDARLRTAGRDGDEVEVHLNGADVDQLSDAVDRAASGRATTVQTTAGPVRVRRAGVSDGAREDVLVEMAPTDGTWWVIWKVGDATTALDSLRQDLDRFEEWRAPDTEVAKRHRGQILLDKMTAASPAT